MPYQIKRSQSMTSNPLLATESTTLKRSFEVSGDIEFWRVKY